jgi:hypothetical protein
MDIVSLVGARSYTRMMQTPDVAYLLLTDLYNTYPRPRIDENEDMANGG